MQRNEREERSYGGRRVVGYFLADLVTTSAHVEDRFNTWLAVELGPGFGEVPGRTLAESGIYNLTLREVLALGFTTDEYKCMLRYSEATGRRDFIRNEYELTALMEGKVPSLVEELQLAYRNAKPGEPPSGMHPFPSRGNRARGSDWENTVYALGWIDDNGDRVRRVPDRFKANYAFVGAVGQTAIADPLGQTGTVSLGLACLVALGFSKAEFIALLVFESETNQRVQSEEDWTNLCSVRNQSCQGR